MWRNFLAFSKKQKYGFWVLMILLLIVTASLFLSNTDSNAFEVITPKVSDLKASSNYRIKNDSDILGSAKFNPNTASIKILQEHGFSNQAILNLKKYVEAGGYFKSAKDLNRIYGVDSVFLNKITPLFVFAEVTSVAKVFEQNKEGVKNTYKLDLNRVTSQKMLALGFSKSVVDFVIEKQKLNWFSHEIEVQKFLLKTESKQVEVLATSLTSKNKTSTGDSYVIELNSADTSELMVFYGIGQVLSNRIIRYRNKIGGFYCVDQLLEVNGVSPIVVAKMKKHLSVDVDLVNPLSVNKASLRRLKEHPYLDFYKAKDIVECRNSLGRINCISEVYKLDSFAKSDSLKLSYYLCL